MKKSNDDIYEISNTQIKNLIDLADFKKTDVFYDLGSGRGRIIRTVSKYVKRAIGVEAEKKYYEASRKLSLRKISQTQLKKIEFWLGEFSYGDDECYEYDISNATVVYNSLVEEDNSEVMYYRNQLVDNVKIIKKDLPLVGYTTIRANRNSSRCWFFLMKTPLRKYKIKSKKKWSQLVLGKENVSIDDVYNYYRKVWKRRGEKRFDINYLKKLVKKRLPFP